MYRVLLVDDEPLLCKGLRDTIEWDSLGLEIAGEAHNGADALKLIQLSQPHIMITDIRMPVMDGIQLIKTIRELDMNIRVIILSGFSDYAFLKEAIHLGVDSYLLKPIDNDELISNLYDLVLSIEKEVLRTTQLNQGMEILRSNTLNRLITNAIGQSEFEEKAAFLDIMLTGEYYLCAVCMAENQNADMLGSGEAQSVFGIHNICNALVQRRGITFIDAKSRVVLLLHGSLEDQLLAMATGVLESVSKQVPKDIGISVITSMGSIVNAMTDLWKSYAVAAEHLDTGKKAAECELPEGKRNSAVERTLAYTAAHYHEALSLKQVANVCEVNTSYLGQIFRKATGDSFTNYVNRYRIEKAKQLLANSSLKVYEVAEKVGFTDYHYFLKIYKKVTGNLPTETRS